MSLSHQIWPWNLAKKSLFYYRGFYRKIMYVCLPNNIFCADFLSYNERTTRSFWSLETPARRAKDVLRQHTDLPMERERRFVRSSSVLHPELYELWNTRIEWKNNLPSPKNASSWWREKNEKLCYRTMSDGHALLPDILYFTFSDVILSPAHWRIHLITRSLSILVR